MTCTEACSNAGFLTRWARPGIEPTSSGTLCQVLKPLSHNGNWNIYTFYLVFFSWKNYLWWFEEMLHHYGGPILFLFFRDLISLALGGNEFKYDTWWGMHFCPGGRGAKVGDPWKVSWDACVCLNRCLHMKSRRVRHPSGTLNTLSSGPSASSKGEVQCSSSRESYLWIVLRGSHVSCSSLKLPGKWGPSMLCPRGTLFFYYVEYLVPMLSQAFCCCWNTTVGDWKERNHEPAFSLQHPLW